MLEARNLSIGYGGKLLYQNISFQLPIPNFVALIGRNGTGKSTLLRTISGYTKPISGSVYWNDTNIHTCTARQKAHYISIMNTEKQFGTNWKVLEWLRLGRYPYTNFLGRLSEKEEEFIQFFIDWLELKDLSGRYIHELSDGEKQRVFLARTLVQDTPILILDEPTAHLDYIARQEVFALLQKISREMQKIIIIATHEIDLAKKYTDLSLYMQGNNLFSVMPSAEI